MRKPKVYGWLAFHPKTAKQVRCIMSATSLREVRAACDVLHIWPGRDYIGVTGNTNEIQYATEYPEQVLWAENDYRNRDFEPWPREL